MKIPAKSDFETVLAKVLAKAQSTGKSQVDGQSGELHRLVGGYPGRNQRMATCCLVMRQAMRAGDRVLKQPPKGKGATLVIRYGLPR